MPTLIILRLRPAAPMAAGDFRTALNGLSITAYDLSTENSVTGSVLGTASGLANPHLSSTTNNSVNINQKQLLQHYVDVMVGIVKKRHLESVATAVIVVKTPPAVEYPTPESYDVRLEITRAGMTIVDRRIDYNVAVVDVPALPTSQKQHFAMHASAYATLPPGVGLDPSLASVDLPPDGQPPSFDQVCKAVDLVLAKDPAGGADLLTRAPLTAQESRHIAAEITWNRAEYPLPPPPGGLGDDPFGAMYTNPPADPGLNADDVDRARMKFEGDQQGYYGTHDADAIRLAGYVFSAAAAIACEQLSVRAEDAALVFPVETGGASATTYPEATVVIHQTGGLKPPFTVPAAYFYALAANVPAQVTPQQRYDMAKLELESRLLSEFAVAADGGSVSLPAKPFTRPADPAAIADQAARRLSALGGVSAALTVVPLAAPITTLVTAWLNYAGTTATIDAGLWSGEFATAAYLELMLDAITEKHDPLIAVIQAAPLNVAKAADLPPVTDQQWRDLFLGPSPPPGAPPRLALLPPFTQPGTPAERTDAFIRHLHKFFTVAAAATPSPVPVPGAPPTLELSVADAFAAFTAAYAALAGGPLAFGTAPNPGDVAAAAATVFPGDADAQAWLVQAVGTIEALYELTEIGQAELQFSLIEALYARGFTSAAAVAALSQDAFTYALTGTVAYPYAPDIYAKSGGTGGSVAPGAGPFTPVNPDGSLTNCIPPRHLSPLGPVEYLHELLQVSAASTCEEPLQPDDKARLALQLAGRRGPLGDLLATAANLDVPLPVVDVVNESLESLAAGLAGGATGGAVYDTDASAAPFADDPERVLAALPQYSSPATPVAQPGAYDLLRSDFTAAELPYSQSLDISRSYICELGSSRFSAMRHFRRDIAELAIDPTIEPADFLRHLWRYPVRLPVALEYLCISPEEYELLYANDIADVPTPGRLLLRELYGFPADVVGGQPWTDVVRSVPEFLRRTGLNYCEFLELWRSGFVPFIAQRREQGFPECEPCCLDDLAIEFPEGIDPAVALRELAVFVRLWQKLHALCEPQVTFAQLRDFSDVLHLFNAGAINPEFVRQLAALLMLRDVFCLPLSDPADPSPQATGADRTHLLAFWVGPRAAKWSWAVATLLDRLEDMAEACERGRRGPEWTKVLASNLDQLSQLAGFDPAIPTDTWYAQPTSTLRFAEVLWKMTLSEFTVGEIVFLFTTSDHLDGDDPFPLQPPGEARDDPLDDPDDIRDLNLWSLRRKLLELDEPDEEELESWTWSRILGTLRHEFGLPEGPTASVR